MHQQNSLGRAPLGKAVKGLLIAMGVVFLVQLSLLKFAGIDLSSYLGFIIVKFIGGFVWQIVSYAFLHDTGGVFHIIINGLVLFMLGAALEARWGFKKFLEYFFVTVAGGALLHLLVWFVSLMVFPSFAEGLSRASVTGASAAIYGLVLAFALMYRNSYILLFFAIPIKAINMIPLMIGIDVFIMLFFSSDNTAHLFHFGGMLSGYLYIKWKGVYLDGGGPPGGGLFRKKKMSKEEVKKRLSVVVNNNKTWN